VGLLAPLPVTVAVNVTAWPETVGLAEAVTTVAVLPFPTPWLTVPLLPTKLPSPAYEAVMVWLPVVKLAVLKLAVVVPAEVVSVPWPKLVAPSEKVTTPVGLATAVLPGAVTLTVAVKVTAWPDADGLTEDATAVPVLAGFTV